MKAHPLTPVALLALLICNAGQVAAGLVTHTGDSDPTTEDWTTASVFSNTTAGPLSPDSVGGLNAWFVNDTGTAGGDFGFYSATLSASEVADATTFGWTLSTTLRIPNSSETVEGSPLVLFRDGTTSWQMHFGSDVDGDPTVLLRNERVVNTGPIFTLQGAGSTYHSFDLFYDPIVSSADLFVDGVERLSNYTGFPLTGLSGNSVAFGAGSSADTGQGNFNHVDFAVAPEPSSLALVGLVAIVVIGYRVRRRLAVSRLCEE